MKVRGKPLVLVGIAILLSFGAATYVTRAVWLEALGGSLVCRAGSLETADAIVVENIEDDYLLFERARQLELKGMAPIVLVPILGRRPDGGPSRVKLGFAEVMGRVAHLQKHEFFSVREKEPITLNFARGVAEELEARHIRSVVLVAAGFRSRRAFEIYHHVLTPLGIEVRCEPVFGTRSVETWSDSWHGIQEVGLQLGKLWYYRLFVL